MTHADTHDEYELVFVPAQDDAYVGSAEYQEELYKYSKDLHGPGVSQTAMAFDSVHAEGFPLGEFFFNTVGPWVTPIITAAGGFLVAKAGRKIRFKHGDIEAEAHTMDEIRQLVLMAEEREKKALAAKVEASPPTGHNES